MRLNLHEREALRKGVKILIVVEHFAKKGIGSSTANDKKHSDRHPGHLQRRQS